MLLALYIVASLLLALGICLASGRSRPWLVQTAYAATVVGSLLTAAKIVPLMDGVFVSVAVGLYSASFLLTDYIGEVYGKDQAFRAVWMGIVAELIVLVAVLFAVAVPAAPFFEGQEAFATVFGTAPRILIASISAFVVAQLLDVTVFHAIRRATGERWLFLRNNASTVIGQTADTLVFYTVAFLGVPGISLPALIITTLAVKIVVALLDTPALYAALWITRNRAPIPQAV